MQPVSNTVGILLLCLGLVLSPLAPSPSALASRADLLTERTYINASHSSHAVVRLPTSVSLSTLDGSGSFSWEIESDSPFAGLLLRPRSRPGGDFLFLGQAHVCPAQCGGHGVVRYALPISPKLSAGLYDLFVFTERNSEVRVHLEIAALRGRSDLQMTYPSHSVVDVQRPQRLLIGTPSNLYSATSDFSIGSEKGLHVAISWIRSDASSARVTGHCLYDERNQSVGSDHPAPGCRFLGAASESFESGVNAGENSQTTSFSLDLLDEGPWRSGLYYVAPELIRNAGAIFLWQSF